jgi:hypothetical protein
MAFNKMIPAFSAWTNEEAYYVCDLLVEAGVTASVLEAHLDFKAEVWIDPADVERAKLLLNDYLPQRDTIWSDSEGQTEENADAGATDRTIEVVCEECGGRSKFPAVQKGWADTCQKCGATVDVDERVPSVHPQPGQKSPPTRTASPERG